jgi:hypothetical protein
MRKLALTLAALMLMFACSTSSAAVVRVGRARIVTRPVVARRAYVAPRPVARAAVRTHRHNVRHAVHDHRQAAWNNFLNAVQ